MKLFTAYRTAIASMEKEIRTLNLDANLHEQMNADYPKAINASKQRKKLRAAIETLQAEIDGKNKPMQLVFGSTND